eukprot:scaffold172293_cov22-Tisochrysis_lutea.AAC.1
MWSHKERGQTSPWPESRANLHLFSSLQTVPAVEALGVAEDLAWIWPSIWQSSYMVRDHINCGCATVLPQRLHKASRCKNSLHCRQSCAISYGRHGCSFVWVCLDNEGRSNSFLMSYKASALEGKTDLGCRVYSMHGMPVIEVL